MLILYSLTCYFSFAALKFKHNKISSDRSHIFWYVCYSWYCMFNVAETDDFTILFSPSIPLEQSSQWCLLQIIISY